MRGLVQRVTRAEVGVVVSPGVTVSAGAIGPGMCVLVGVTHSDNPSDSQKLANKIWNLRIFDDADGVMNVSMSERVAAGEPCEVLVVSQFTLYGDTRKGRRPGWSAAARPEHAEPLIESVVAELRRLGATVATGRFRTEMHVELVNDGPITVMVEVP